MNQEQVTEKIIEIIADNADYRPEEIQLENSLMDDLSLTSMDILTVVSDLEKTFSVKISEKMLRSFITVQDVADCILAAL